MWQKTRLRDKQQCECEFVSLCNYKSFQTRRCWSHPHGNNNQGHIFQLFTLSKNLTSIWCVALRDGEKSAIREAAVWTHLSLFTGWKTLTLGTGWCCCLFITDKVRFFLFFFFTFWRIGYWKFWKWTFHNAANHFGLIFTCGEVGQVLFFFHIIAAIQFLF